MANGVSAVPQFNINDELDGIALTTRQTPAKATAPAPAAAATKTAIPADNTSDVSFDDEGISEVVKQSDGLPMLKISKGQTARFSFVPGVKMKRAMTHYVQGIGSMLCNSTTGNVEVCCRKSEKPASDHFIALIYRYTNVDNATGKFVQGATAPVIEVQAVRLSRSNLRDCLDACEDGQSVYDLDIRMAHDQGRAFGYKLSRAASKPTWKSIEAQALALSAPFADGAKLASRLGKKLDGAALAAAFASGSPTAEASLADIADLDS